MNIIYKSILGLIIVTILCSAVAAGFEDTKENAKLSYGFWPYWAEVLSDDGTLSYEPDWDCLTHVSYFCMDLNSDGTLTDILGPDGKPGPIPEKTYEQIKNKAHSEGVKVTLSVRCHNFTVLKEVLDNHIDDSSQNILTQLEIYGADGVCIDFEGDLDPSYKDEMENFMQSLHSTLNKGELNYHISLCVGGLENTFYYNSALSDYVDHIILMGYDYHYPLNTTGPVAPFNLDNDADVLDVDYSIKKLLKHYDSNKIILALPFYGWIWDNCTSEYKGSETFGYNDSVRIEDVEELCSVYVYTGLCDVESNTQLYRYQNESGRWHQCWYDDEYSLGLKLGYVNSADLAGAGYWALSFEGNDTAATWNSIWDTVEKTLYTDPSDSLDLIFLIDTTGSMADDIDNVKSSASEIVGAIDSKNYDYRVSVAEYRDLPSYGSSGDYVYKLACPFSNDKDEIIEAINSLTVDGGGDIPESVYSGLVYAMTDENKDLSNSDNYGWRQGVTKQIILMGDAPAHDPEPWEGGYTLDDVVYWSENIDPIIVQSIRIGSDGEALTSFSKISSSTAGNVYTSPTADEVVDTLIEVIEDIGSTSSIDVELYVNGEDSDTPPGAYLLKGDNVTWTYIINNTGTVSLEDIEIVDDNMDLICSIDSLLPGESSSCIVEESAECGQQGKRISMSINYTSTDGETQITDEDSSYYFGACPDLKLDKFTNGYDADSTPGIQIGDSVKWNYVITNTGNVPLTNISLMDDKEGIISCPKDTLEVGESIECEHIGVVEYGYYENIANISGEFNGFEVYAEDKGVYYGFEEGDDWTPVAVPTAKPIITVAALGIFVVLFLRRENK